MKRDLPLEGDIVKCIKDYAKEDSRLYGEHVNFVKGELYIINHYQKVYVSIINNRNRIDFVSDTNIYNGIQFFEYFEFYKKASDCKLYDHSYYNKGFNDYEEKIKTENKHSDRNFKLNNNSNVFNFTKIANLKTYKYLKEIRLEKGYKYGKEYSNTKLDDSNLDLSDNLESIIIHNTRERISIYNREENVIEEENIVFNLKKLPKKLKNIEFINVKTKSIKADLETLSLEYSEVEDLQLNPKTLKRLNLQNVKIGKCNIDYFIDYTNGCGSEIYTFKLDDDTFLSSFSNGRLTRNEISQACSTLQLKETIKYFELDDIIFNYDSCLKGEKRSKYSTFNTFKFIENDKLYINLFKDEIVLFSNHITKNINEHDSMYFSFTVDPEFNIKVYKTRMINSANKNRNGKIIIDDKILPVVLSNKYLNFLSKFSENVQLPVNFFNELFMHPTVVKSKNTGVINISEFTFDSFRNTIYENCIAIKYFNKKWYWYGKQIDIKEPEKQYDIDGYDKYGYDEDGYDSRGNHKEDDGDYYDDEDDNDVPTLESIAYNKQGKNVIEWSNLGFEIDSKKIKNNSMYVKPGVKDYYESLGHGRDEYFHLHNKIEFPEYDEDKEYSAKLDIDELHDKNYMILDTGIFFNQDIDEFHNISKKQQFRDHFNGGNSPCTISLKSAELLAKKYKFKLFPNRIQREEAENLKYLYIGRICSGENLEETSLNYVVRHGLENSILLNQKDLVRKDKPFIKIGNKIYHYNEYNNNSTYLDIVGDLNEYKHKGEIKYHSNTINVKELLKVNNLNFSYVNIDISVKLKNDVMRFIKKHYNDLYHAYKHAYNQMLPFMFYRIAYINNTFEECLEYKYDEKEKIKISKKTEDEFQTLKSELKVCFENTLKRIKQK